MESKMSAVVGVAGHKRCFHHRHHLPRNPQCRPTYLSNNDASNRHCSCQMEKSNNKYERHQRGVNLTFVNYESNECSELENKSYQFDITESSCGRVRARQPLETKSFKGKESSNRIGSYNSPIDGHPSNPSNFCSLYPTQLSFCHENVINQREGRGENHLHGSAFKFPVKNNVISQSCLRMIAKIVKLALLTFISTSVIIVPCNGSLDVEHSTPNHTHNHTQFISQLGGGQRGGSNFGVNPSSNLLRSGESITSDIYGEKSERISSHANVTNKIVNNSNKGEGESWLGFAPPQYQNDGRVSKPKSENDVLLGPPFVRAHSTGFMSLVEGDKATKEASVSALTGGKVIVRAPQLVGAVGGEESSTKLLKVGGSCLCWNTTDDGLKREVECKCTGKEMTNVAGNLPADIHRLTVEQAANFTTLVNEDLKPYGSSLNELVLTELQSFHTIKNGTFLGMRKLNTIYIHGAPALTQISNAVFNIYLPELKIIRITHSSLEVVPNLSKLSIKADAALHMVELDNNKISRLIPGSFEGLITEHLALSYNDLEEIEPYAFNGSTIARLTLKGNPLKVLHSNSFVGIDSLRVLDLSETQITYLPTQGLNGLESLRLEKVWTLSVIPSIYHFPELEEAWLTWPYHCCAFEYPETHDPAAFQRYKEYIRSVVNDLCAKASANASTEIPDPAVSPLPDKNTSINPRQKRHLRLVNQINAVKRISTFANSPLRKRDEDKYWGRVKRNTQVGDSNENKAFNNIRRRRDDTNRSTLLSQRLIVNEPMISASPSPHVFPSSSSFRLKKRSLNGHHPMQTAQQQDKSNGLRLGKNDDKVREKSGDVSKNIDGFHHNSNSENPLAHYPFDDDGSSARYENMGHEENYDPFVFDPDQSFSHDLEHESDIRGNNQWGTFDHASEAEFDDDLGIFHPSVTPSPTVITLCGNVAVKKIPKIACQPLPDAFNPCEDIMGSIWLRGAVWVVVSLALFGNTAVLVVLLLAPGRISVQRFLMANLSCADLCMGLYLLMVATQDLVSLGSYFNYAIDWQLGWGCQIAGFLTVFASELSVFTLCVITGERWYALTRAIHLTKRLTLLGASQLMAFGWFMAILLAALPLMGVSSYSKTSICLPMEAHSGGAVAYLIFLLLFNGVAFLLVACAYWQMYRAVAGHGGPTPGGSPAASSADTAIAKKMALLVFTDFACWAPVAFFGLTAVGGMPLIGVTDAKILLVFFYPLNACCNPYLYAILTKQYRRDLLLLLSRHGMCTKRAARYKTGAASTNNTMQTMQTVLRMGSMTETKVAGSSGTGRNSLLNGKLSTSGHPLEDHQEDFTTTTGLPPSSCQEKYKNNLQLHQSNILDNSSHFKTPSDDFRKPNLKQGQEEDDVFDLNGLSGRHIAETTFISIPLSPSDTKKKKAGESPIFQNGDPAKEKLIQHQVEHHHHSNQTPSPTSSTVEKSTVDRNNSNSNLISPPKDEQDLDHEITETTPFCSGRN